MFWKTKNVSVLCLVLIFALKQGFQWPIAFGNTRTNFLTVLSLSSASVSISKTVRVPIETLEQRNDYLNWKTVFLSSQFSLIKNEASLKTFLQREFPYCSFWGTRLMFLKNQKDTVLCLIINFNLKLVFHDLSHWNEKRTKTFSCFISIIHFIFHQQDCWGSLGNSWTLKRLSKLQKNSTCTIFLW